MNKMNHAYDDEIDLFELLQTLWDNKWKIVATAFMGAVIGVFFSFIKPSYFEVTIPFQSGKQSAFLKYMPLNDLLKSNNFSLSIDEESMFKMFIVEFRDYEEMIDALSSSEYVQKSIKGLGEVEKQRALMKLPLPSTCFTLLGMARLELFIPSGGGGGSCLVPEKTPG